MNCITISGRIAGRDAIKREVGDHGVISFSVSDNKKIKGEWQTVFFDVSLWGNRDGLLPLLVKGANVVIVGELQPPNVKGDKCYLQVRAHDINIMREAKTEQSVAVEEFPF